MAKHTADDFEDENVETLDDFDELLSKSFDDIPMPKDLPLTKFFAKCEGFSAIKSKKEGVSPQILEFYRIEGPVEDLDPDVMAELGENYNFNMNRYAKQVWLSEGRDWKVVQEDLDTVGVDRDGLTILEAMKAAKGKEVVVLLKRGKAYTDKETGEQRNGQIEVARVYAIKDED